MGVFHGCIKLPQALLPGYDKRHAQGLAEVALSKLAYRVPEIDNPVVVAGIWLHVNIQMPILPPPKMRY
jgi:hypothetical protein